MLEEFYSEVFIIALENCENSTSHHQTLYQPFLKLAPQHLNNMRENNAPTPLERNVLIASASKEAGR